MATIAALRDSLKRKARIQASEQFTDGDVEAYITDALREHNSEFSFDVLPLAEEEPVLLLAWIRICHSRAARWAEASNMGGHATLQQDNETPFKKNMDLAKALRAQYDELISRLGLEGRSAEILVSTVTAQDGWVEAEVPLSLSRSLDEPILALAAGESKTTGTTYILNWTADRSENFQEWRLFHLATATNDTTTLRQKWNQASLAKTPQLEDTATLLKTISDQRITCLKATNVDKTKRNLFLLVALSRSGIYSYSNELELKP